MLDAAELKLRAERRLGELLAELVQHGGDRKTESTSHGARLKDMGLTWSDSSRWQKLASIDEEKWEEYIALKRQEGELTTGRRVDRA